MPQKELSTREFVWTLGSCCALHGKPFDAELVLRQFVPPYLGATMIKAGREFGFHVSLKEATLASMQGMRATVLLLLHAAAESAPRLGLLVRVDGSTINWIPAGSNEPLTQPMAELAVRYSGQALVLQRRMTSTRPRMCVVSASTGLCPSCCATAASGAMCWAPAWCCSCWPWACPCLPKPSSTRWWCTAHKAPSSRWPSAWVPAQRRANQD